MTALLKNQISPLEIENLASLLKHERSDFETERFLKQVINEQWPSLTLKQRIRTVSQGLTNVLTSDLAQDFSEQIALLLKVHKEFDGLFHLIFPDYIELNGIEYFDISLAALAEMTQQSTAEFAIRVFLECYPEQTRTFLIECSMSENEHLRRLASEGVRPRLPWAKRLHWIDNNPTWVLPIIEHLKNDESRYVKTSVANLLNDLSKANPQWVLSVLQSWSLNEVNSRWIAKHALRTLLKKGDEQALALMGYPKPDHINLTKLIVEPKIAIGQRLDFAFTLLVNSEPAKVLGLLRIEYAISFLRKTQQPYRKVFKISESVINSTEKRWHSSHNFKPISTRKYVAGNHRLDIIVNGQTIATREFLLID